MSKKDNLKRVIVDFKKLTPEILELLVEKYPDGYDDTDIITFRNLKNEVVEAVEVRTSDTIYLVKVGTRLIQAMEDYGDDDSNDDEVDFEGVKGEDEEEETQDEDEEDYDE